MSLLNIFIKINSRIQNGIFYSAITTATLIPVGIYTQNYILKKLKITDCEISKRALREQMSFVLFISTFLGFYYGYRQPLLENNK